LLNIELKLHRDSGKGFNFSEVVSQELKGSALKLTLKDSPDALEYKPGVSILQQIELKVTKPTSTSEGSSIFIVGSEPGLLTTHVNPVTKKVTNFILVESGNQEVEILNDNIPEDKIESALSTGSSVASTTGSMGVTTDILGMLGLFLSADQTGATLKFSQICKLISRLRYVDINYGKIFGTFLNGLANAFDKKISFDAATEFSGKKGAELEEAINTAKKRIKFQNKFSNGRKGKFNTYLVDFFLIGKSDKGWMDKLLFDDLAEPGEVKKSSNSNSSGSTGRMLQNLSGYQIKRESGFNFGAFLDELKYWIYLISWLNKIIAAHLIRKSRDWDQISVGFFNYVTFSQKIHLVLFNLVSVDAVFVGTRTILHTKLVR